MTFEEWLDVVLVQCAVHGRAGLHATDDVPARQLGFRSPEGRFMVGLGEVRRHFAGPWERVSVQRQCVRLGRVHVPSLVERYKLAVSEALARGEVAYRAGQRQSRARA